MSSTLPFPGPPPTGSPPGPPSYSPLSDTSTLLFGFLVSALSIFAVFMTSALVWNRLVARRRALEATQGINSPSSLRHHRPTMWNVWAVPDKQLPQWLDVKPVAAQQCDRLDSSSLTSQTDQNISFWKRHLRHLLDRLPPEISYIFHPPISQASTTSSNANISRIELPQGSDVQISLLISMPHAPKATQGKGQRFNELVFATTNVHYHDPFTT